MLDTPILLNILPRIQFKKMPKTSKAKKKIVKMLKEKTDILIIGAGAAGAATAWNLSKTNFKITCLDQGPLLKKEDYSFNNKF